MSRLTPIIEILEQMKSDKISNYAIPGLDSYLLQNGKMRIFKNSRNHHETITPHSHRYDFTAMVLQGVVRNTTWLETEENEKSDLFQKTPLIYGGVGGGL